MSSRILLLLWALTAADPRERPAAEDVRLLPGVPIFLSDGEPEPVRLAVDDLRRDLRAVFGVESPRVDRFEAIRGKAAIVISGPATGLPELGHRAVSGRESHGVFVRGPHVVLQWADPRGTVYAIYTFSEHVLGIPPLWFWASRSPAPRERLDVAAGTEILFGPPFVRWRAWFPNDTDLLSRWRGRSRENSEAFLETMLRLKLNTLEGGMMDSRRTIRCAPPGSGPGGGIVPASGMSPLTIRDAGRRDGRRP